MQAMRDYYIFDIPVYRCEEQKYYAAMDEGAAKHLEKLSALTGISREKALNLWRDIEEHFWATYGGPWEFNQTIGWIRLYAEGSYIGGNLWWVNAKRIRRNMRKTFSLTTYSNILATYFTSED